MEIKKSQEGKELTIALEGRLDTMTSPELEAEMKASLPGADSLVMDLSELAYISSAGLRVLLAAQKVMSKKKGMVIRNAGPEIKEIFAITGFSGIFTIE